MFLWVWPKYVTTLFFWRLASTVDLTWNCRTQTTLLQSWQVPLKADKARVEGIRTFRLGWVDAITVFWPATSFWSRTVLMTRPWPSLSLAGRRARPIDRQTRPRSRSFAMPRRSRTDRSTSQETTGVRFAELPSAEIKKRCSQQCYSNRRSGQLRLLRGLRGWNGNILSDLDYYPKIFI